VKSHIAKLLACLALIAASLYPYNHPVGPAISRDGSRSYAEGLNIVSAASLRSSPLAQDSEASAFGSDLASEAEYPEPGERPTILGGTTVSVQDSTGVSRLARLSFVSPKQVSFTIPPATQTGTAKVTVAMNTGARASTSIQVAHIAPGVFTLDGTGQGLATTTAVRVDSDGRRTGVFTFDCIGDEACRALPIDISRGSVIVSFFGTGVRGRSSLANVSCKIGGLDAVVIFAGVQYNSAGPDRLDVLLPLGLKGRGDVTVVFTIDGQSTNPVTIRVQ
jgi:uncharacterized protein (TIGR03437 family)